MDGVIYYPYIRVPQSAWFTRLLLYWDDVATIVPSSWLESPERLQPYTLDLVRRGLVEQVVPDRPWRLGRRFAEFLDTLPDEELESRRLAYRGRQVERIHQDKGTAGLFDGLRDVGLSAQGPDGWWYVESKTAADYMAALALDLAAKLSRPGRRGIRYTPVTDQRHSLLPLLEGTRLVRHSDAVGHSRVEHRTRALRMVSLERLFPVPRVPLRPERIEEFKLKHQDLLPRFRRYVEERIVVAAQLGEDEATELLHLLEGELDEAIREVEAALVEFGIVKLLRSGWVSLLELVPLVGRAVSAARKSAELVAPHETASPLAYAAFANVTLKLEYRMPVEDHPLLVDTFRLF